MLGIGVGIDYALLILTRYRAALARGAEPRTAVAEAISTAGRSVLIAGTTVVISLLGLFVMGLTYLYGVALAAIIAVLVVMAARDHAAARAARRSPGARIERCASRALRHRSRRRRSPPAGAAPCSAARGRRDRRRRASCSRSPRPSPACGSASRTPATTAPTRPRARPTTSSRSGFGAGANGPLLVVAPARPRGATSRPTLQDATPGVAVGRPAAAQPGRRHGGDPRHPAHVAAGHRDRGPHRTACATAGCGAGRARSAGAPPQAHRPGRRRPRDRLPLFIGGVVGLSLLLLLVAFRSRHRRDQGRRS